MDQASLELHPLVSLNEPGAPGIISWKYQDDLTYVCSVSVCSGPPPREFLTPPIGSGPTGALFSGESSGIKNNFLISGTPDQYVGFFINIITNIGTTSPPKPHMVYWDATDYELLGEAKPPSEK